MPKISVIVPVYGVEKYIERCINSLFAQTMDDIQFVFVDDCTPDRSMDIIESYIAKKENLILEKRWSVTVTRMPVNSGLARVREEGMKYATGEFVIHCDSDDWIEPEMLELMYSKAIETHADMVVCDFRHTNGETILASYKGGGDTNKESYIRELVIRKYSWALWNKLVRREKCYNDSIVYAKGNMGEDLALTMQLLLNSEIIAFVPIVLYNYFYNENSISNARSDERMINNIIINKENALIAFDALYAHGLDKRMKAEIVCNKWLIKKMIWNIRNAKDRANLWHTTFNEIDKRILLNRYIEIIDKIKFVLACLNLYPHYK